MHKTIIAAMLVAQFGSSGFSQTQHLGVWSTKDEQDNTLFMEFAPDNRLISFQARGTDTLFGYEARYTIDYSKSPIWLDMIVLGADRKAVATIKMLAQVPSDSEMILQKSKDPNVRPNVISFDDKELCGVLHKVKGAGPVNHPTRFVLFDSSLVEEALNQCSRGTPAIEGKWNPTQTDIASLEGNLGKISSLSSGGCCLSGIRIHSPASYYRQYVGIIVNGRKMIYVNAFSPDTMNRRKGSDVGYWRKQIVIICDGGESAWGCIYDVQKNEFSSLAVNGVS